MISDKYLLPSELRAIADYCDSLNPLWDALTSGQRDGVSIESDHFELLVYDSNGEHMGYITWSDGGPAFFLNKDDDAKQE
jgi:hypothetical protein